MKYKLFLKDKRIVLLILLLIMPNIFISIYFYNVFSDDIFNRELKIATVDAKVNYTRFLNWFNSKLLILEEIENLSHKAINKRDLEILVNKVNLQSFQKEQIYIVDNINTIVHKDVNGNNVITVRKKINLNNNKEVFIGIDIVILDIIKKLDDVFLEYTVNEIEILDNKIVNAVKSKDDNVYYILLQDENTKIELLKRINTKNNGILKTIMIIFLLVYSIIIIKLFNTIFKPFEIFNREMEKITNNDYFYKVKFIKNREFVYIYKFFNNLANRFNEIYYKKIELEEKIHILDMESEEVKSNIENVKIDINELYKKINIEKMIVEIFNQNKKDDELNDSKGKIKFIKNKILKKNRELKFLTEITNFLTNSKNLDELLFKIADRINKLTTRGICTVRLLEGDKLVLKAKVGEFKELIKDEDIDANIDVAGEAIRKNKTIMVNDFKSVNIDYEDKILFDKVKEALYIPLTNYGEVIGLIIIAAEEKLLNLDFNLLKTFAIQASIAIEKINLYSSLKENYFDTIKVLITAVEAKDSYTEGHSIRVSKIAGLIAKEMNYKDNFIEDIEISGILHDIGKIGIEDRILTKEGKLTYEEYEEIKKHSEIGYKIIKPIELNEKILEGVLLHHYRFDKKGYPQIKGITRKSIVPCIIGLADAIDAMTSTRSYSKKRKLEWAIEEVNRKSNTQFNPVVVKAINKIFKNKPNSLYDIIDE
ncbi:MAG: hypothetical protein B6I28_00605 [Fusobacteriia bacterium 4572_132]|nr:MAG: hypothetical protein B6I28_00605 [Fusobacteriia bacterium 4572_132]